MQQQSAISPRRLYTTPEASRDATYVRKLWLLFAVLTMLMLCMAASDTSDARYNKLGHRMICMCESEPVTFSNAGLRGCKQVLLECNHPNCDTSGPMRGELRAALQKGDSDELILQSFVRKYGGNVVEQSSAAANNLIRTLAFAVVISIAVAFLRKWESRPATVATPPECTTRASIRFASASGGKPKKTIGTNSVSAQIPIPFDSVHSSPFGRWA